MSFPALITWNEKLACCFEFFCIFFVLSPESLRPDWNILDVKVEKAYKGVKGVAHFLVRLELNEL